MLCRVELPAGGLNHQHDLGPERQCDASQEGVTGMEGTGMDESGDMGQAGDMKNR
jgi:hypothetical protein